jgi:MoxR-like ATPase
MSEITTASADTSAIESLKNSVGRVRAELGKVIIGQDEVIEQTLIAIFTRSHALLVGVPGLAKTLLISSLAETLHLTFKRIQFTPDLMPSDITGTEVIFSDPATGEREFKFLQGPIFANIILADEINRTPPKTQAALLEAMQEHQVTAGGESRKLEEPFFVLATQNPIEMEGTYPLPEAQLDRFMFNVVIDYLPEADEVRVVTQTTGKGGEPIQKRFTGEDLIDWAGAVRSVPIAEEVARYAVRLSAASRPGSEGAPDFVNDFVSWGAGLRAAQNLVLGGKARALIHGRSHVTRDDIRALAHPVLRHRILVNYQAEAEGISPGTIIDRLLAETGL